MAFVKSGPKIEIPRNRSTSTTSSTSWGGRRVSLWSRYNKGVAGIGNWIADHVETVTDTCSAILFLAYVVVVIVLFVQSWIEGGFLKALLMGVLAGIVGFFVMGIAVWVVNIVMNVILYGLRILFWNGWTLLLVILGTLLIIG